MLRKELRAAIGSLPMKKWPKRLAIIAGIFIGVLALIFLGWFWLLPNGGKPRTVNQSVALLLETFPPPNLNRFANEDKERIILYHHSLGMHIRNEHGLWAGNLRLLLSIGHIDALHADNASGYILMALWEELQDQGLEWEGSPDEERSPWEIDASELDFSEYKKEAEQ